VICISHIVPFWEVIKLAFTRLIKAEINIEVNEGRGTEHVPHCDEETDSKGVDERGREFNGGKTRKKDANKDSLASDEYVKPREDDFRGFVLTKGTFCKIRAHHTHTHKKKINK
jgi:hypothetical protein